MFDQLIQEVEPCNQGSTCRNSILNNPAGQKCSVCRLAPNNQECEQQFWSGIKGAKHSVLEEEKHDKNVKVARDKQLVRLGKDKKRKKLLTKAVRAEASTESSIIRSTVCSGRVNRDSDHIVGDGFLRLDTKMQSKNINPTIRVEELEKACQDAKRGGSSVGGLVIRNKNDQGFIVFREADFSSEILARIIIRNNDVDKNRG